MPEPMPWAQLVLALWPVWVILAAMAVCWKVER